MDIILGALATALNVGQEELSSTLKDEEGNYKENAEDTVLEMFSQHVSKVKASTKEEVYGRATREVKTGFEKEIIDAYEFDNSQKLQGIELVKAIAAAKAEAEKKSLQDQLEELSKKPGFTEDDLKKHPAFIQLEQTLESEKATAEERVKSAIEQTRAEFKKEQTFGTVKDVATTVFEGLNPILSEDATRKANQIKNMLIAPLSGYDWQASEDGQTFIPIDKESGKRLENSLGHPIYLTDLVKTIAEKSFDFSKSSKKVFSQQVGDDKKVSFSFDMPKTQDEYAAILSNSKVPHEEKIAIRDLVRSGDLSFK